MQIASDVGPGVRAVDDFELAQTNEVPDGGRELFGDNSTL